MQSSFPRIELTLLLVSTATMPWRAVRVATASSKAANEDFLIGPIDLHGLKHSVDKALDDARYVFQGGAAIESELVAVAGELVSSDPKMRLLKILIVRFQIVLWHRLVETTTKRTSRSQHEDPVLTEISLLSNLQTGWSSKGHANELPTTCSSDLRAPSGQPVLLATRSSSSRPSAERDVSKPLK